VVVAVMRMPRVCNGSGCFASGNRPGGCMRLPDDEAALSLRSFFEYVAVEAQSVQKVKGIAPAIRNHVALLVGVGGINPDLVNAMNPAAS